MLIQNSIPLSTVGVALTGTVRESKGAADVRSDGEMVQGLKFVSPDSGCSAAGDGGQEGGGVGRDGSMASGIKDLCCRAISAFRWVSSNLLPVNK